jgi:hypothetical protein
MKHLSIIVLTLSLIVLQSFTCNNIPAKNAEFISYLEKHGKNLAPTYESANCVEFLDKVLTNFSKIDEKTSERIYINYDIRTVERLLVRGDSTIVSGVCWALVSCNKAHWIKPKDAKVGDIIQYWSTDGFTNGHCGVICGEDETGYLLYSSHQDSEGFGVMQVKNKTVYKNMKLFIVRLN